MAWNARDGGMTMGHLESVPLLGRVRLAVPSFVPADTPHRSLQEYERDDIENLRI